MTKVEFEDSQDGLKMADSELAPARSSSLQGDDLQDLNTISDSKNTIRKMANRINELCQDLTVFK